MFPKGNVQQQVLSAGHVRQLSQICQKITTNQGVTRTLEVVLSKNDPAKSTTLDLAGANGMKTKGTCKLI
jgi:hypothetical protein